MDLDNIYRVGLWMQCFRDSRSILPQARGDGRLTGGLGFVSRILKENRIGKTFLRDISDWKEKLESKYDEETKIDIEDAMNLRNDTIKWNAILHAELTAKHVVEIELQSGLNPEELLKLASKKQSEFITVEVWKRLTDIEQSDLSDAAKCLLLGTATPSVMVALRGAEACIRSFYHSKTGKEPGNKTWRQLINELKSSAQTLGIADTFIGYLDYYGEAKRNLAQHPNKLYSVREAVIIFMQVIGMVEDVYEQL